jgi:hypothetical protein
LPESQPFELTGRIEGEAGGLALRELKVLSGESDLSGEVRIRSQAGTRVEANLSSRLLDVTPFLSAQGASLEGVTAALAKQLPLDSLHGLDGALRWEAGQLRFQDLSLDGTSLEGSLDGGHLQLKIVAREERLLAEVELEPAETDWRLDLHHKGDLNLSSLLATKPAGDGKEEAPVALDLRLSGLGRSPQAMLASADGYVKVVVGAGRINKRLGVLVPLGGLLVTLLDNIRSSGREEQYTDLECAVIQLDVAQGIATSSRGIALQTDALNVLGGGALKLATGEIDFQFKTVPRKGLGISLLGIANKFIRITGKLHRPQVKVDPKGVLIHGGAAWATGGLSLLYTDLASRLTAFVNPCEMVRERKAERTRGYSSRGYVRSPTSGAGVPRKGELGGRKNSPALEE